METVYARGVAAADRARGRAERGYTIAGAVAAALVAADVFTGLTKRPALVQILVLGALGVWLCAVMLFIWAVAVDVRVPDGASPNASGWTNPAAFVESVTRDVQEELKELHKRQRAALTATAVAMVLTVSALVARTFDPVRTGTEKARIALSPQAETALTRLCGTRIGILYATLNGSFRC